MTDPEYLIELNGAPATADDLRHLVQTNYGHFSAMRVEDGGVRGLDLHLERIQRATRELFGSEVDRDHVRACLRHAVGGRAGELSLRVNVFARTFDRDNPERAVDADLLVTVAPASRPSQAPLRVKSFRYTRDLPQVKHVGTFPLFHHRRLAQQAGFEDALFVDAGGLVEEGSIWNVGFWDGAGVVWPEAPQLTGVSMQLLQAGLQRAGIGSTTRALPLGSLRDFRAAFFTNSSTPVRLLACIDEVGFAADLELAERLQACHDANSAQAL